MHMEMSLSDFFRENPKCALAYSGGVDSAYLLYEAMQSGADVTAFYVKTAFQPRFEYEGALSFAASLGARVCVLEIDVLAEDVIAANPSDRCYYCKQQIMGTIRKAAAERGYSLIMDGTNASDDAGDRPGMRALAELEVRSPLRLAGISKAEVRRRSREAGLPTWDRPAYACLATRIRTGEKITEERLRTVEEAEDRMMKLGFEDLRVRTSGRNGLVQIHKDQKELLEERREDICSALGELFEELSIDESYRGE